MGATAIPYATKSWNVVTGCTPASPGCANCWAGTLHNQRHKALLEGKKLPEQYREPFSKVQLLRDRLDEPLRWRKPQRVFVGSTGDLFHYQVPADYIDAVFGVMAAAPQHLFLTLTKRPDHMLAWVRRTTEEGAKWGESPANHCIVAANDAIPADPPKRFQEESIASFGGPWPLPNVILGATVCNQEEADRVLPIVGELAAKGWRTWLSVEPMLGPVDIGRWLRHDMVPGKLCSCGVSGGHKVVPIEWAAIGAESAPRNRMRLMDPEWGAALMRQCRAARVRVFMKQLHVPEHVGGRPRLVTEPRYFPTGLAVRELPAMPEAPNA